MATEATVTVPPDEFPLGSMFERLPDVTIELERIGPARDATDCGGVRVERTAPNSDSY